jgi:hypothetical protein
MKRYETGERIFLAKITRGHEMRKLQSATSEKHLRRLWRICAALPETSEKLSRGEPTFFVRKKVFASKSEKFSRLRKS